MRPKMDMKPSESSAKRMRTDQGNINDENSRPRQQKTPRPIYGQPTNPMNHIPEHLMQFSEVMGQLQRGRQTPYNVQREPDDYMMSGGLPTPNTSKIPSTMPPHIGKGKGRAVDSVPTIPTGFGTPMPKSGDPKKWGKTFAKMLD